MALTRRPTRVGRGARPERRGVRLAAPALPRAARRARRRHRAARGLAALHGAARGDGGPDADAEPGQGALVLPGPAGARALLGASWAACSCPRSRGGARSPCPTSTGSPRGAGRWFAPERRVANTIFTALVVVADRPDDHRHVLPRRRTGPGSGRGELRMRDPQLAPHRACTSPSPRSASASSPSSPGCSSASRAPSGARAQARFRDARGDGQEPAPARAVGRRRGLRQVWLPDLDRVDRCTTCHLGIDDPAFATRAGAVPHATRARGSTTHPVERFGCTVCHDGQGEATDYAHAAPPADPVRRAPDAPAGDDRGQLRRAATVRSSPPDAPAARRGTAPHRGVGLRELPRDPGLRGSDASAARPSTASATRCGPTGWRAG